MEAGEMDQERPLLVEAWLGGTVLVEYMGGQLPETGAGGDTMAEAQPRVKTARFVLENYNRFGIEVRPTEDSEPQFLAWGAVLRIAGTDQETPEDQREREQVEQMEESGPQDRQELIDRSANARTPAEVADARAAADSWLAANPGDGDVRLARERLQEAYPEEDLELEEGSPT
jgi:hypothetical protein